MGNQSFRGKNSNQEHPPSAKVVGEGFIMVYTETSLTNVFPRVSELSLSALSVSFHANKHICSNEYEK